LYSTSARLSLNPLAEQKITGRVEYKDANVHITVLLADQSVINWTGSPLVLSYDIRRPGASGAVVMHASRGAAVYALRFRPAEGMINRRDQGEMAGGEPRPIVPMREGDLDPAIKAKLDTIRTKFFTLPYDTQKRILLELQASPHPEARELARELLYRF
jgi:hypothetical protein